jgi:LysR family transcriptional regulator, glycine cleavage system transcriptional activator
MDWKRLPPLTALRAFAAVAQSGSFSAAARALNVTHAAVAQQVRALEEHLDQPLVARDGRALALTAEGEQLAAALNDGFATMQRGIDALRATDGDRPLRISLTAGFAAQWLMPRLRDFWSKHPDIALTLHPDPRPVDLRREGMDLAIRYGNGDWPGVKSRFLTSARLVIVGAPDLLAGRTTLTRDEMAAMPWVLSPGWPEQTDWLRGLGLDPDALDVTELPTEELCLAAAREGLGLLIESHALVEDDLRWGNLHLLLDRQERLPAYFTVTAPGPQRRALRAFLSWLDSAA